MEPPEAPDAPVADPAVEEPEPEPEPPEQIIDGIQMKLDKLRGLMATV
jgi:hypothetical protein